MVRHEFTCRIAMISWDGSVTLFKIRYPVVALMNV